MAWQIWCEVVGGVTGYRTAWLKSNGAIREFATQEEAESTARQMNQSTNRPGSKARFTYTARLYSGPGGTMPERNGK